MLSRLGAFPTDRYAGTVSDVFVAGTMATVDTATGLLVEAAVATGLVVVGAHQISATGDGTTKLVVERWPFVVCDNDGTDPVTIADLGGPVYVFDSTTVSSNATGTSVAGTLAGFYADGRPIVKLDLV